MARRVNGEGTIFRRKDGRYMTQVTVTLTDGAPKRVSITKCKREEVKAKMDELLEMNKKNIRLSGRKWTVGDWMDYWLKNVAKNRIRYSTWINYEVIIRMYIKPHLGNRPLTELSIRDAQFAVDKLVQNKVGGCTIKHFRQVLSCALNRAVREEIIFRNIASHLELPIYRKKPIVPWTVEESVRFLESSRGHMWYPAILIQLTYGMRLGKVIGLRWADIDWRNNRFFIRQQICCFVKTKLIAEDVKTEAGRRELPLVPAVKEELIKLARQQGVDLTSCFDADAPYSIEGTVVRNQVGGAIDPHNYRRSFNILVRRAGVSRITNHTMRHTATTLFKRLGVPLKDVQAILDHSDPRTTQNVYEHGSSDIQINALKGVNDVLCGQPLE